MFTDFEDCKLFLFSEWSYQIGVSYFIYISLGDLRIPVFILKIDLVFCIWIDQNCQASRQQEVLKETQELNLFLDKRLKMETSQGLLNYSVISPAAFYFLIMLLFHGWLYSSCVLLFFFSQGYEENFIKNAN